MSSVQINRSQQYKYIIGFILLFIMAIIIISYFSYGKEHGLVLYPNVSYNFEIEEFGGEYTYSGQIINNEDFDLKILYFRFVNEDNNIIEATKFENLKSGETRNFRFTSQSLYTINTEKVKLEISTAEK